ncbi:MAG TPA: serine hydrolase domain-containing protein [Flavisolibacter sp.]|jgi:CubicO group peptidase (beta-lactamase class C family)|nr:serine hydrolase domain-containing protein [Flavisolibacter sp.]
MKRLAILFFVLNFSFQYTFAQVIVHHKQIDSIVTGFMKNDKVPGVAIAILREDSLLYQQCYGLSNLELKTPVTNTTVFELSSVTKQMTAALIATLAQEGKLSLNDTIGKYLDNIPEAWQPITIRQLLGHMGGFIHKFEPTVNGTYLLDYSKEFMLEAAKKTPMNSVPGTDWEYSDEGYFLAGYIAEKATGKIFDSLMKEKLFVPMKMNHTRFLNQNDIIPNRAAGYIIKNGEYKNNRRQWQFELTPHFGVMSTIDDMVKYDKGITRGLLNRKAFEEITTPYRVFFKDSLQQYSYGLGWEIRDFIGKRIVMHSGYTGTVYLKDLQTGLSIIVLTNRDENQGTSQHVLTKRIAKAVEISFPAF